jgi:hypothetical protein
MDFLSPDHVVDVVERTLVVVLRRPPTAQVLNSLGMRIRASSRLPQGKVAYLHVVLDVPTTGRVDEGIREAFVAQSRRALPHVEGAAMILLRTGFGGAAMRAAVSSGLVLVRPSVPVRTFSRVEDGVQWLCGLSSPPRDARAILATTVSRSEALLENYTP